MKPPGGLQKILFRILLTILSVSVLTLGFLDFYDVAAGTRNWIGKFTLTWGVALAGLTTLGIFFFLLGLLNLWEVRWIYPVNARLATIRDRFGWVSWLLALAIALIPTKIFLYTPLGLKLGGVGFRLTIFIVTAVVMAVFTTRERGQLLNWTGLLTSLVILGAVFVLGKAFVNVVDHPLSLTWSEGNRIWDYSIFFGRDLYNYPQNQPIEAYIDKPRQTLWGLPFLLPGISIIDVRAWSAIVFTVPYTLLGWMAFKSSTHFRKQWFWLGLWAFIFLYQGPIYTPLILSAILVAGARRKPIWIALPLIFLAGHYAQGSRITWMVGPVVWALMVALVDFGPSTAGKISSKNWGKITAYGLAGFLGGFGLRRGWMRLYNYITRAAISSADVAAAPTPEVTFVNPDDVVETLSTVGQNTAVTSQALLWERLLPNPTYGLGIILGLLLAVGPLVLLIIYMVRSKKWKLNNWQQLGIFGALGGLMGLGVLISTKIGGGGDLHNLDMFFVAAIFASALAWESGGSALLSKLNQQPLSIKIALLFAAAIPAFMPWVYAVPLELPPAEKTDWTLKILEDEANRVISDGGEVLFMDQRQLLTFRNLGDIPLVPEYEKKLVMDRAMSGDTEYFEHFYQTIAQQRFGLIVTDPQRIRFSDEEEGWGAENDTWVQWVTAPLLCYYEPAYTIKKTGVWLLEPILDPGECPYP